MTDWQMASVNAVDFLRRRTLAMHKVPQKPAWVMATRPVAQMDGDRW